MAHLLARTQGPACCSAGASTSSRLARRSRPVACRAEGEGKDGDKQDPGKKYIGDMGLLDFMYAGPKMRKWYGAQDLTEEGKVQEEYLADRPDEEPPAPPPEAGSDGFDVFVTDAETSMGEQLVLQLILARASIRVLVRDVAAAKAGFGPYIDPVSMDVGATQSLSRALKGVRTLVLLGRVGGLLAAAKQAGVERVVLLSSAGMPQAGGLAALFGDKADGVLREPQREQDVARSGVPYVVVKTGAIRDVPGGVSALSVRPGKLGGAGSATAGAGISREDLAAVVARAAELQLPSGAVVEVVDAGAGQAGDIGAALLAAAQGAPVA